MINDRTRTLSFSLVPTTLLIIVSMALVAPDLYVAFALFGVILLIETAVLRSAQTGAIFASLHLLLLTVICVATFYFLAKRDIAISLGICFVVTCMFSEQYFAHRRRKLALSMLAIASAVGWLAAIELVMPPGIAVFSQADSKYPKETWRIQWRKQLYNQQDPVYGWKPNPGVVVEATGLIAPDQEEWRVRYTIDENGQRVVPGRPEQGPSIVLLGGSFTFGHGLDDDQTIAAQLQEQRVDDRVYCHGVNAYGTTQCLLRLRNSEETNLRWVFYFSIDNHLNRNAGDAHWMRIRPNTPLLEIGLDGRLVPRRSVLAGFRGHVDRFLAGRSFIYEKIQTLPPWIRSDAWKVELTASLIAEMDRVTRTRTDSKAQFVTVFLPQLDLSEESERQRQLKQRVHEMGIHSIDVRDYLRRYLTENPDTEWRDLFDVTSSHPTPLFASLIAKWCSDFLQSHSNNLTTRDNLYQKASRIEAWSSHRSSTSLIFEGKSTI